MATSTQKKKSVQSRPSRKAIHRDPTGSIVGGIICLLLGLCVIVTYFGVDAVVPGAMAGLLGGLTGYGYWLWGPAFLATGIVLLLKRENRVVLQIVAILLLPGLVGVLIHLIACPGEYGFALEQIRPLWKAGQDLKCGGVLCGSIAEGCISLFSRVVALLLTAVLLALSFFTALWRNPFRRKDRREERPREMPQRTEKKAETPAEEKKEPLRKRKVSPTVFDIPLDEEPRVPQSPEAAALQPSGRRLLPIKDEQTITPAEFIDPSLKTSVSAEAPAAPTVEGSLRKKMENNTAQAVADAADEVSAEIEKELSEEEEAYRFPSIELLDANTTNNRREVGSELKSNASRLSSTLLSFGVDATPGDVIHGPSVTRYEFTLSEGVKLSKLTNLSDDIALALGASGVRIAPVPGKIASVGIEVPNRNVTSVCIRDVIGNKAFTGHPSSVAFAVGKDIGGNCIVGNIAKLPHVLIAGTTGSGKSVCTNSLIVSLLYKSSPEDVRFIMVDPKMVELAPYNGIPHLLIPVVTDPKKAAGALQWAVFEMMKRYKIFSENGVKDLAGYNALASANEEMKKMPSVVVVIDELADLMLVAAKEVEESICRVAQMGRAAGMHLVIATQRPSADVITGLMKANIPSRIAFAVASSMESRIILDTTGAEKLIGRGDMLYFPLGDSKPTRVQGCFISPEEIERVVAFVKETGDANYDQSVIDKIDEAMEKGDKSKPSGNAPAEESSEGEYDEMLCAAVEVILETGQASVSMLQRRLKLGYSRAARLVDQMEEKGIVGPFEGSKPRQLLINRAKWQEMLVQQNGGQTPAQTHDPYGSIRDAMESRDALD